MKHSVSSPSLAKALPAPKPILVRLLPHAIAALALCFAAIVGTTNARAESTAAPAAAASSRALPWVDAEIRKVDMAQGKVTLKHGEIPNMDMPPMTMVFKAVDPGMLKGLIPGDKVRFQAEESNGTYMAVQIEKQP